MADRPNLLAYRDNPRQKRSGKYNNERCMVDGLTFDSKAERDRWLDLQLMQRAGVIEGLERQVRYELIPKQKRPSGGVERECAYVADFVYMERGVKVCEDVKGAVTPEFRIKRKLMLKVHGVEVREVKR